MSKLIDFLVVVEFLLQLREHTKSEYLGLRLRQFVMAFLHLFSDGGVEGRTYALRGFSLHEACETAEGGFSNDVPAQTCRHGVDDLLVNAHLLFESDDAPLFADLDFRSAHILESGVLLALGSHEFLCRFDSLGDKLAELCDFVAHGEHFGIERGVDLAGELVSLHIRASFKVVHEAFLIFHIEFRTVQRAEEDGHVAPVVEDGIECLVQFLLPLVVVADGLPEFLLEALVDVVIERFADALELQDGDDTRLPEFEDFAFDASADFAGNVFACLHLSLEIIDHGFLRIAEIGAEHLVDRVPEFRQGAVVLLAVF